MIDGLALELNTFFLHYGYNVHDLFPTLLVISGVLAVISIVIASDIGKVGLVGLGISGILLSLSTYSLYISQSGLVAGSCYELKNTHNVIINNNIKKLEDKRNSIHNSYPAE